MGLAIVYARVSTEEQAEHGQSLGVQVDLCRAKAKELGFDDVTVLVDEGVSGEILERPALAKARALLRSGGVSAFLCYDPDRLARKLGIQLLVTEEIEKAGAKLVFIKFEKGAGLENNLFYQLRGAIAEYEKGKILERTAAGKRAKSKSGKLSGFVQPYGYRYVQGKDCLEIVPEEAAVVRRIFDLAAKGWDYNRIARTLMDEGIPGPKQAHWYPNVIRGILHRDSYLGIHHAFRYDYTGESLNRFRGKGEKVKPRQRDREEWTDIPVPAILTPEEWAAAQSLDGRRYRTRGRSNAEALLRDLCYCGLCGKTVHTTGPKHNRYYACAGRHTSSKLARPLHIAKCELPYQRSKELEDAVWIRVKGWIGNPAAIVQEANEASQLALAQTARERNEIERLLSALSSERERTLTAYTRKWLNETQVEERMAEISGREKRLRDRLGDLESEIKEVTPAEIRALNALRDSLGGDIEAADKSERKRLIGILVERIVLYPGKVVIHTAIPESDTIRPLIVAKSG